MFVNTVERLRSAIDTLVRDTNYNEYTVASLDEDRMLFVDFEGVSLCRSGELCIGQFGSYRSTFIIDFIALGRDGFYTESNGISLKSLLESSSLYKGIFDPRNDSDAIYAQYQVLMKKVICLQTMRIAILKQRGRTVRYSPGLKRTLEDVPLDNIDIQRILRIKERGTNLFRGDYTVWKQRPLDPLLIEYCEHDVTCLVELFKKFKGQLDHRRWMSRVLVESERRVQECMNPRYDGNSKACALAPSLY